MKIAVITSIYGLNHKLPKANFSKDADYFVFTDEEKEIGGWEVLNNRFTTSLDTFTNRRNARIFKILPEIFIPNYDFYFWHDSTHELILNPKEVICDNYSDFFKKNDFGFYKHPHRNNALEEAFYIKALNFDHKKIINEQIKHYRNIHDLSKFGLFATGAFIRKNNNRTRNFALMWWEQICKYSSRDQISLPYVCCKLNHQLSPLPGDITEKDNSDIFNRILNSDHNRKALK